MSVSVTSLKNEKTRPQYLGQPGVSAPRDLVIQPAMKQKYIANQSPIGFFELPEEVLPRIVEFAGEGAFRFGLTCKYFTLAVRDFLTENPKGKKFLRETYQASFREVHRMSVVSAFRDLSSSSYEKLTDFDDSDLGIKCITQLKEVATPVCIATPSKGKWLSADVKSALATRSRKLTVFEINSPDEDSLCSTIEAIQAVPSTGFAALIITSKTLSSSNIAGLRAAISGHPVVAVIQVDGDHTLAAGKDALAWLDQLSNDVSELCLFVLNGCELSKQDPETLSNLLAEKKGITELEICDATISLDNANNLIEAVRKRNVSPGSKLTLYFAASDLEEMLGTRDCTNLRGEGIFIRRPGQPWYIQLDPEPVRQIEEEPTDEDERAIVSGPDSDDTCGSEFEKSGDDSDVIIESSSDSET